MTKFGTIIECLPTDYFNAKGNCDLTYGLTPRKPVDYAEFGAGTEIYEGEEREVLKSSLFDNLKRLREGYPIKGTTRKPSQRRERGSVAECGALYR
jgi:hypothetical protein